MKKSYICNITNQKFIYDESQITRESPTINGYNSRERCLIYCLIKKLNLKPNIFSKIQENKNIKGIGISDNNNLAQILYNKFNYTNTFFHKKPYLDIYNTKDILHYTNLDFIICSEIFEHISPYPGLFVAFNNLNKMLCKNGVLIFSCPYNLNEHKEHFPTLYKYTLSNSDNQIVLNNTRIDGTEEKFTNLIFHGGDGSTLEMRQFSKQSIYNYLIDSGFYNITFHPVDEDMNKHGIFWESSCSLIVTANKHEK